MTYKLTSGSGVIRVEDGAYIPADADNRDWQEYQAWLSAGNTPLPVDPPTFQQQVDANVAAIQAEMDRQAKGKGYDDIVSACSYAVQPAGSPFQAEGAAFLAWRSQVWTQAYAKLAQVQAGTAPMPTPEQAVADMPALVLP